MFFVSCTDKAVFRGNAEDMFLNNNIIFINVAIWAQVILSSLYIILSAISIRIAEICRKKKPQEFNILLNKNEFITISVYMFIMMFIFTAMLGFLGIMFHLSGDSVTSNILLYAQSLFLVLGNISPVQRGSDFLKSMGIKSLFLSAIRPFGLKIIAKLVGDEQVKEKDST